MNKIFIMIFSIAIIFAAASGAFAYGHGHQYGARGDYRASYGDRNYSHGYDRYHGNEGCRGNSYH